MYQNNNNSNSNYLILKIYLCTLGERKQFLKQVERVVKAEYQKKIIAVK